MPEFHDLLMAVHGEIWDGGTQSRPCLSAMLAALEKAPLPSGVERLSSSHMAAGPHLAAQEESGKKEADVVWLEAGRLARARAQRFAMI